MLWGFGQKVLNLFLMLALLAIAGLEPAFGGLVFILPFIICHRWQVLRDARDGGSLALLRGVVARRHPSQGRARREER